MAAAKTPLKNYIRNIVSTKSELLHNEKCFMKRTFQHKVNYELFTMIYVLGNGNMRILLRTTAFTIEIFKISATVCLLLR